MLHLMRMQPPAKILMGTGQALAAEQDQTAHGDGRSTIGRRVSITLMMKLCLLISTDLADLS